MNCTQFTEWLDEGGGVCSSQAVARLFLDHAKECGKCRKSMESFNRILRGLESIEPDESLLPKILGCLEKKPSSFEDEGNVSKLWKFLIPAFAGAMLIFLGTAISYFSLAKPVGKAVFLEPSLCLGNFIGKVRVIRGGDPLENVDFAKMTPYMKGDVFHFSDEFQVFPSDANSIRIGGKGRIVFGDELKFQQGQGIFNFSGKFEALKIRMPRVILTVTGTVLHLKIEENSDKAWVAEGKVEWEILSTKQRGNLNAGSGLSFASGNPNPLHDSPINGKPENPPEISPSSTGPVEMKPPGKLDD